MRINLDIESPHLISLCNTEDHITILKAIEYNLIYNMLIKGIKGIKKVSLKEITQQEYNSDENCFKKISRWSLNTDGTNMKMLFREIPTLYMKKHSLMISEKYIIHLVLKLQEKH